MRRRLALAMLALAGGSPAAAQQANVTSAKPDHVALTVYRAQHGRGAMDVRYLQGFALIAETRRIRVPAGEAVVRFEGVAEGIVPVSAVVDGLPGGVVEKNRDARLLSPASLIDGTLGRPVTLTRTDKATGARSSEEATVVAGPRPGVVLRTRAGIETLRCSGLPERLAFGGVPAGLSAKPVLSVTTRSRRAATVTVRLTYLASGFDWRANYVATVAKDGRTLDLFAWLTLANGNPQAIPDAEVNAVAGRLNRVAVRELPREVWSLRLSCYPLGTTTSDLRAKTFEAAEEIVVTASRAMPMAMMAPPPPAPPPPPPPPPPPEDLGDLKLYRVPERATVGARGQKQVALLARTAAPFERRYRRSVSPGQTLEPSPSAVVLVLRNRADQNLGLALPAGGTALYAEREGGERLLLGLGTLGDRADGEMVRIAAGVSAQVQVGQATLSAREAVVRVTNANRFPVVMEVPIGAPGQKIQAESGAVAQVDGVMTWSPRLEPGGSAELRYRY